VKSRKSLSFPVLDRVIFRETGCGIWQEESVSPHTQAERRKQLPGTIVC